MENTPGPDYEIRLRSLLEAHDWEALREFTREQNQIPDEIYQKDEHFWEVLMHKLICNRMDLMQLHGESRKWLADNGYSTDLGGY